MNNEKKIEFLQMSRFSSPIKKSSVRQSLVLILFVLSYFSVAHTSTAYSQSPEDWVKRFNNYALEYSGLLEKCLPSKGSVQMFLDISNCVWRKEQVLLKKYKLESILYDVSYDRYKEMFHMGKTAGVQYYEGGVDYFSEASARLQFDTQELQREIMKEFLISEYYSKK